MSQHSGHSKGVRTSVPGSRARRQRGPLGTISHAPTPGTGGPPARLRTQRGPSRSARPSEHERQAPRARPRPRHRTPRPAVPPVPQRQLLSPHLGGRGEGGCGTGRAPLWPTRPLRRGFYRPSQSPGQRASPPHIADAETVTPRGETAWSPRPPLHHSSDQIGVPLRRRLSQRRWLTSGSHTALGGCPKGN